MTKKQKEALVVKIAEMKIQQYNGDIEEAHVYADNILCEMLIVLGAGELVKEWEEVDKWYA